MDSSAEHVRFRQVHAAFCGGDLKALRAALPDPDVVPNGPMPATFGPCLVYAVYHSPLNFVRELLELGADPNVDVDDGFPPLFAALWRSARRDTNELVRLLLSFGADPNQRGHNDYTVLHVAVLERNREAAELLLAAGGDPRLRTRIDEQETVVELAESEGLPEYADLLRQWADE
jgi:ankyrin repeat protein